MEGGTDTLAIGLGKVMNECPESLGVNGPGPSEDENDGIYHPLRNNLPHAMPLGIPRLISSLPATSMAAQFRVFIVRHGETDWNRTRRIQGQLDVPLNEIGSQQAMLVAEALKEIPFARAFSSDLQRASKTAEHILAYHPETTLELDESMRERYMGELQGVVGPSNRRAPSLERIPDFVARALDWYSRSIIDYMNSVIETGLPVEQPINILVVSHGGWITALLSTLQANGLLAYREDVETGPYLNTGLSIIDYTGIRARGDSEALVGLLVLYSNVQHLEQDWQRQETNVDILLEDGQGAEQ